MLISNLSPVFHSTAWLQACATATGGQVIGVPNQPELLLLRRKLGPFTVAGAPLPKSATPMSTSLRGSKNEVENSLRGLSNWFPHSGLSLLQVTSPFPPPMDCHPSRVEQIHNLEIDLTKDCEHLWSGISTLSRRMIRKALRERIRVSVVRPSGFHLVQLQTLSAKIFADQRERPIVSPAQYDALESSDLATHARLFAASRNGQFLGYLLTLADAEQACYWDVAVGGEGRSAGAGHLLLWTFIRWCKRHGIPRLDLMGPPEGGRGNSRRGIGRFKMAFGAEPVDYHVVYWNSATAGIALDLNRRLSSIARELKLLRV